MARENKGMVENGVAAPSGIGKGRQGFLDNRNMPFNDK
jgi:hypothetical protein